MRIFKNAWFVRFDRAKVIWNAVLLEAVQDSKMAKWMPTWAVAWLVR
jgi:hypothetical protein